MDLSQLRAKYFPRLTNKNGRLTSPEDRSYNCIAWAAGVNTSRWEPDPFFQYYWPPGIERRNTIRSYRQAFAWLGFDPCDNSNLEPGFKKIALYAENDIPKHASRQVDGTWWTSKLGNDIDIEHTFNALDGGFYGNVVLVFRKST